MRKNEKEWERMRKNEKEFIQDPQFIQTHYSYKVNWGLGNYYLFFNLSVGVLYPHRDPLLRREEIFLFLDCCWQAHPSHHHQGVGPRWRPSRNHHHLREKGKGRFRAGMGERGRNVGKSRWGENGASPESWPSILLSAWERQRKAWGRGWWNESEWFLNKETYAQHMVIVLRWTTSVKINSPFVPSSSFPTGIDGCSVMMWDESVTQRSDTYMLGRFIDAPAAINIVLQPSSPQTLCV